MRKQATRTERISAFGAQVVLALAVPAESLAQQAPPPQEDDAVAAGLASSFAVPADELLIRQNDAPIANLLEGLTVTPSLGLPLSSTRLGARQTGDRTSGSPVASLTARYQPVGHWFAQGTIVGYLDPVRRARWNPDFTYSFGYDDWHPYTLSLVYSNYANNRFSPAPGAPVSPIGRGTISLGWKAPMPRKLARLMLIDESRSIDCRVGLNASPRFDRQDGTTGRWKTSANVGCRYPFSDRLYFDFNAYAYGRGQQPWDPDFTYGFGLFDHRSNRLSIQYNNYSGTRFPWRKRARGTGRFADGGMTISWNHGF